MKWKCTLEDGTIKEESNSKFNLDWEDGGVSKFELIGEDKHYSVNLKTGQFDIDGKKKTPRGFKNNKKYLLRWFKRNKIKVKNGKTISKDVTYFMGYESKGEEKLLKINDNVAEFDTR